MEKNRREFLKNSAALAVILGGVNVSRSAFASAPVNSGLLYSKENPGMWSKKVSGHAPIAEQHGSDITITTKHSMTDSHFIVRHTLVLADGSVAGSKTFSPSDEKAVSTFKLPVGYSGKYFVTSFCNKHDLWVTEGHS